MNEVIKRVCNLLTVKSLVTLVLTVVFAVLAVSNRIAQDFMTIYAVIIAFYFGTQASRTEAGTFPTAEEIAGALQTAVTAEKEAEPDGEAGED